MTFHRFLPASGDNCHVDERGCDVALIAVVPWSIQDDKWLAILKLWASMTAQQRADGGAGVSIVGRWHDTAARKGVARVIQAANIKPD